MKGSPEAKKLDATIECMMEEDPITQDSALRWLTFVATLEPTLIMIKKQANDRLGK